MSSGPLNLSNQQLESASFNSPWEASLFALAVQLSRQGVFTWADWTKAIGEEIRNESADNGEEYYHRWCDALQNLLISGKIVSMEEIKHRTKEWHDAYANTPHGRAVELPKEKPPPDHELPEVDAGV